MVGGEGGRGRSGRFCACDSETGNISISVVLYNEAPGNDQELPNSSGTFQQLDTEHQCQKVMKEVIYLLSNPLELMYSDRNKYILI